MPDKSSADPQLPPERSFPRRPASWYLFGRSADLRTKPLGKTLLGRRLAAFRTPAGEPVVLDARCPHMGADLSRGVVEAGCLRCPFHHWRFAPDGRCENIPASPDIPAAARVRRYAARERDGYLFVFNGAEPLFPLPFFPDLSPGEWQAGGMYRFVSRLPWYLTNSNAFDMQHFALVHGRILLEPAVVDCPAPFARRNRYHARVAGGEFRDRVLRRIAGPDVRISITLWGGTFLVITADYARVRSRFLLSTRPISGGRTLCEGIVYAPRGGNVLLRRLWSPLLLEIRRRFTQAFLSEEVRLIRGVRYQPRGLIPADAMMADYFRWLADLPQEPPANPPEFNARQLGSTDPEGASA